ncbi:MAG: condensation domain-containing protein, partial [Blastocatellia bacterium]
VPSRDEKGLALALRGYASGRLPAAMVPSNFVFLKRLPLTPNGKVDMSALATVGQEIAKEEPEYVVPRTPMEQVLAAVWEDLLGVARVSVHDNFFELGGHSLLATRVAARLNQELGVSLSVRTLFERPTIADLACEVQELALDGCKTNIPPIKRAQPNAGALPLSFAQQRLWVLNRLDLESPAYNIPSVIRLGCALDLEALSRSLAEVVRRHEILRTTFPVADGHPVQVIGRASDFQLRIADLQGFPENREKDERRNLIVNEARRPFDLGRGPLLRAALLLHSDSEPVLLITMHHIISDGWSRTTMATEIMQLYRAFRAGSPPSLPEPPLQFSDFAIWQRDLLQGELIESLLEYWRRQLHGAPPEVVLPLDRPRPVQSKHSGAIRSAVLDPSLTERITGLSRQTSASLFMVLLTALDILLFRWTGQSDLVIGTVTASRNRLETEGLLGCFINFLPIRSRLSDVQTGAEVLKQTRATVLEAYNYQDCPFDLIVETVNPTRSRGISPIYNVAFVFQNVPKVRELKLMENLGLTLESVELQTSLLDLRFVASETAEGISFLCEYNAELFEPETIDSLMDCYEATLRKLAGQPAANICDYELTERLAARARRPAAVIEKQMIAIASTFTAEPVEDTLRFWARKLGLDFEMTFAPFNQVFQQLLDPASLLSLNRDGANVVLLRFEDWRSSDAEAGRPLTGAGFKAIVEQNIGEMADAFRAFAGRSATPCIVCLCPASPTQSLHGDDAEALRRMEDYLKHDLEAVSGVHLVTSSELASKYPVADYYD